MDSINVKANGGENVNSLVKGELGAISRKDWTEFVVLTRPGNPQELTEEDKAVVKRVRDAYLDSALTMSTATTIVIMQVIRKVIDLPEFIAQLWRDFANIQYDLEYHTATSIERLLIEQIVVCWLQLSLAQFHYTGRINKVLEVKEGVYWDKHLTAVHGRYLRAIESLTRIRRLSRGTPVQINIGGQQVNIAGSNLPIQQ